MKINYRPISVISVIAEIYEKLVYEQLSCFAEQHKIITRDQSGLCKNHSTETAFIYSSKPMASEHGQRFSKRYLSFLDLKIAFDTVDMIY